MSLHASCTTTLQHATQMHGKALSNLFTADQLSSDSHSIRFQIIEIKVQIGLLSNIDQSYPAHKTAFCHFMDKQLKTYQVAAHTLRTGEKALKLLREIRHKKTVYSQTPEQKTTFRNHLIWIGCSLDTVDEQMTSTEREMDQFEQEPLIKTLKPLVKRIATQMEELKCVLNMGLLQKKSYQNKITWRDYLSFLTPGYPYLEAALVEAETQIQPMNAV